MAAIPSLNRVAGIGRARRISSRLGCAFVMLGNGHFALIDKTDENLVRTKIWYSTSKGYARNSETTAPGKVRSVLMHRWLLGLSGTSEVDHRNRIKWDNRRANLRIANDHQTRGNSPRQKNKRSSRFKGVYRCGKRWKVVVGINSIVKHLGCFATEHEAARAYNEWARNYFGEFAYLNPI
jgi:hypothetical protein